ncbi:MAG: hypothetical protein HYZ50_20250 [Deltaproteobacteria bacterium]|nr:hypothetical protein [Deltaproteobacteria bacterium]
MSIEQHTYTSCPRGKGYDQIDGLQTKARSAGLTDMMNRIIRHYCEHYRLPRSMQSIELELRTAGQNISLETLAQFPVVVSYYPIAEDVFALTRINYIGRDHSGRFGNFFAHTLVFPVDALQPFDYNPLMLARANIFQSNDTSDQTTLPSLPDFHGVTVTPNHTGAQLAAREPYRGQLAHLLSATSGVKQAGRSVILCFSHWDATASLLETAFSLLPKETRCRIAFTTYEQDPSRFLRSKASTQLNAQPSLQIIATPSRNEGGQFEFRPEQYQSQFVVLNFAEQKYSPQPTLSAYAQHVTESFLLGQGDHITTVQDIITQMEVGQTPAHWDVLLPVVHLGKLNVSPSASTLQAAVTALVTVTENSSQATAATLLLWPTIESLLGQAQKDPLKIAIDGYKKIVQKLAPDAKRREQVQREVGNAVYGLLREGLAQRAQMLLPTAAQDDVLLTTVLKQLVSEGWFRTADGKALAHSEDDRKALIELFANGLLAMQREQETPANLVTMLIAMYEAAEKIVGLPALWFHTGQMVVLAVLDMAKLTLNERQEFSERLLGLLGHNRCPEGVLAIRLWRWTVKPPKNEEWFREAPEFMQVALQNKEPERAVQDIVQQVESLCDKEAFPIVVAAMWESVDEKAPIKDDVFCEVYNRALQASNPESQWILRRLLVQHQCVRMLCYDLWESWTSQNQTDQDRMEQWRKKVFETCTALLPNITVQLSQTVRTDPRTKEVLSFINSFLRLLDSFGKQVNAVYDPLLQVAIERLPLSPDQLWQERISRAEISHWPKPLASRLHALVLINKIDHSGKSLSEVLQSFPEWTSTIRNLALSEQDTATHWLLGQFGSLGTDILPHACANAKAAVQLLGPGNHSLTEFLTSQLKARGLVSQVLLLAAFAQLAVEEKDRIQKYALRDCIASCLKEMDRRVRNAFEEYLHGDQQFGGSRVGDEFRKLVENREARVQGAESSETSLPGKVSSFFGWLFGRRQ